MNEPGDVSFNSKVRTLPWDHNEVTGALVKSMLRKDVRKSAVCHEITLEDGLCCVAHQVLQLSLLVIILQFDVKEERALILKVDVGGHVTVYRDVNVSANLFRLTLMSIVKTPQDIGNENCCAPEIFQIKHLAGPGDGLSSSKCIFNCAVSRHLK